MDVIIPNEIFNCQKSYSFTGKSQLKLIFLAMHIVAKVICNYDEQKGNPFKNVLWLKTK